MAPPVPAQPLLCVRIHSLVLGSEVLKHGRPIMSELRKAESFFMRLDVGDGSTVLPDVSAGEAPVVQRKSVGGSRAATTVKVDTTQDEIAEATKQYARDRDAPLTETDEGKDSERIHHQCTECSRQLLEIESEIPFMTGTIRRLRDLVRRLASTVLEGFEEYEDEELTAEDVDDLVEFADHVLSVFSESGKKDLKWTRSLMRLVEASPAASRAHIEKLESALNRCHDANYALQAADGRPSAPAPAPAQGKREAPLPELDEEALAYIMDAEGSQIVTLDATDAVARLYVEDCPAKAVSAGLSAMHFQAGTSVR